MSDVKLKIIEKVSDAQTYASEAVTYLSQSLNYASRGLFSLYMESMKKAIGSLEVALKLLKEEPSESRKRRVYNPKTGRYYLIRSRSSEKQTGES